MAYLPSSEMCRVTLEPCRIFFNTGFFKQFLGCHDQYFPCRNCSNDVREMKFNATGQCLAPLVQTESSTNHYAGKQSRCALLVRWLLPNWAHCRSIHIHLDIEGCGIQCTDPLYTDEEHEAVHTHIFWGVSICIASNLFVLATFLIHDWKKFKHPAWNLFYISFCFLLNWIG